MRDSTISGTTNGIRIKTWQNSPGSSSATNMTFKNISMKGVANPIIIDQMYCPYVSCPSQVHHTILLTALRSSISIAMTFLIVRHRLG